MTGGQLGVLSYDSDMNRNWIFLLLGGLLAATPVLAQTVAIGASVPYTPSWSARHQLRLLSDLADLQLPTSHWPLPAAAVEQALQALPASLPMAAGVDLQAAREAVLRELQQRRQQASLTLQLRQRAEGLPGFDDNYTPGSSVQLVSEEKRVDGGTVSLAGR